MHNGWKNTNTTYTMTQNDQISPIPDCTEEKDVGVIFDNNLPFDVHIQTSINTVNRMTQKKKFLQSR